jgi:hypothetical protein
MIKNYPGEQWKPMMTSLQSSKRSYMISNHGRVLSFLEDVEKDGRILKTGLVDGYPAFNYRKGPDEDYKEGNVRSRFVHKLVAQHFIGEPPTLEHKHVIHLDYDKENNRVHNLRYATKEEVEAHLINNPNYIESRKQQQLYPERFAHKLSSTDVIRIKKKIWDPNRKTRLKMIAKQFGISEMQLYRIKSGENWSSITVPEEEAAKKAQKKDRS